MTETQATPGATGAPTTQADPDDAENGAPAAASGRAAVGRATVPGDSPSPKYTRAPGMVPPPDRPAADRPAPDGAGPDAGGAPTAAAAPLSPPTAPPGPAKPPV
ncbi:MAG TPA: DUF3566 domain-containing protein, partial [Pilimelia sp.]|nr:DUF3566 domain-containing protein [Pilimelia sp.]